MRERSSVRACSTQLDMTAEATAGIEIDPSVSRDLYSDEAYYRTSGGLGRYAKVPERGPLKQRPGTRPSTTKGLHCHPYVGSNPPRSKVSIRMTAS